MRLLEVVVSAGAMGCEPHALVRCVPFWGSVPRVCCPLHFAVAYAVEASLSS